MSDIARDLGISTVTVSKVLNNSSDISAATRQRVLDRVRDLGYQPNLCARALAKGRTSLVGLLVPDVYQVAEFASSLTATLRLSDLAVMIQTSNGDAELEAWNVDRLLAFGIDALVIEPTQRDFAGSEVARKLRIPFIVIGRRSSSHRVNCVKMNEQVAEELAITHLEAIGCRRIALIGDHADTAGFGRRGTPILCAQEGHSLLRPSCSGQQSAGQCPHLAGYGAMLRLLQIDPRPDAVYCFSDATAVGAMQAISSSGLRIPEDISVLGSGNCRDSQFLTIPLSSIDHMDTELGIQAASLAINLIKAVGGHVPVNVLVEPNLIIRSSTTKRG